MSIKVNKQCLNFQLELFENSRKYLKFPIILNLVSELQIPMYHRQHVKKM